MTEESKALKRARKSEERMLGYATKAFSRYQRAVAFRKLVEDHEEIRTQTAELGERLKDAERIADVLRQDIEAAVEKLPPELRS